jgi:Holliday junction resolvase RusA-like endonuclease
MKYVVAKFVIPGEPIPKARARTFFRGERICTYDPQSKEKKAIQTHLLAEMWKLQNSDDKQIAMKASNLTYSDRYCVKLTFYMAIPKSFNRSEINESLWGVIIPSHCDLDNLIKMYLDCANGILYPDDRRITSIKACKKYSTNPRTEFHIMGEKTDVLEEDTRKILSIYGPQEIYSLLQDINEFFYLYDMQQKQAWLSEQVDGERFSEEIQMRTAYLISRLADHHTRLLKKINDVAPHYWNTHDKTTIV